jgi:hypothetical protein
MPEYSFLRYQHPPSKHWPVKQNKRPKYSLKILFNITLPDMLQFQGSSFSSGSEVKICYEFLIITMRAKHPSHLTSCHLSNNSPDEEHDIMKAV